MPVDLNDICVTCGLLQSTIGRMNRCGLKRMHDGEPCWIRDRPSANPKEERVQIVGYAEPITIAGMRYVPVAVHNELREAARGVVDAFEHHTSVTTAIDRLTEVLDGR